MLLGSTLRRRLRGVNPGLRKVAHTWLNYGMHGFIPVGQRPVKAANCRFRRNLSLSRFLVTRVSLPEFLSRREDAGSVAAAPRGEVEFRYTSFEGEDVVTTLDRAPVEDVARGLPVRRFGSHAGMGHYPGWWWSATMSAHVGYESLLERDRLMLADFDRGVTAVASRSSPG